MKSKVKSFFQTLLGLQMTKHQLSLVPTGQSHNTGVRLARVPFFVLHVVVYAVVFFVLQLLQSISVAKTGYNFELGQMMLVFLVLILSLLLFPTHVRRAHDIGWSMKYVFYWSLLPAILRVVCMLIPFFTLFNPNLISGLFTIMPYVGLVFWALMQVQLAFMVLLFFAPGTGLHNRYGNIVARSFTLENLYGFRLFTNKNRKSEEGESIEIHKITDEDAGRTE